MMRHKFLEATAALVGTIIGAGIFALPYVVMKAGVIFGVFYFLFLGLIVLTNHLIFGEIVLRTSGIHQFVGYGEIYFGKRGRNFLFISSLISLGGSTLAFLILGGNFLSDLIGPEKLPLFGYIIIFWAAISAGIILGWGRVSFLDFLMVLFVIAAVILIAIYTFPHFKTAHLQMINVSYFLLPWGVIFYALSGGAAVPELREIIGEQKKLLKGAIILGTLIPLAIYLLFVFSVVGALGPLTSVDTVSGLKKLFGDGLIYLISAFGLLSVSTSALMLGMVLKRMFIHDLKINKTISLLIVCLAPLIFYFLGLKNFVRIITFLGLWLGAVEGIFLLLMHDRAKRMGDRQPEYSLSLPKFIYYLIGLILVLGPILTILFHQY